MTSLSLAAQASTRLGACLSIAIAQATRAGLAEIAIFCGWIAFTLVQIAHHEMWRDEVRALSLAIDPSSIWAMLDGLRGEGHPALWYLILRGGHALTGSMLVLPVAAFLSAAAGVGFLLLRAPFSAPVKLVIAASAFVAVEYPVIARNYGISALPIFILAAHYDRWRQRGIGLGLCLFVLANTNIHSTVVAAALLGMWFLETVQDNGLRWSQPLKNLLVNGAIAGSGFLFAALIVRGAANDAVSSMVPRVGIGDALSAVLDPGLTFWSLAPGLPSGVLTALMLLCLFRLVNSPALLLTGLGTLVLLSLLFAVGFMGFYRHAAIWLLLLIALFWIAELRRERQSGRVEGFASVGNGAFLALLALQIWATVDATRLSLARPWSNSKEAAAVIRGDPRLADAIVVAEPDFFVEPLRYYGIERTYLLREQRFGRTVNFTRQARLSLGLGEILADARRLKREFGSEVVVLISEESALDPAAPARSLRVGYNWRFTTTPEEVASFLDGTERLATLTSSLQREDYTLYRVK